MISGQSRYEVWSALLNFFCPCIADAVCGAPKRRFKPYEPKVAKNANATDARKARKEQLKKDEAVG